MYWSPVITISQLLVGLRDRAITSSVIIFVQNFSGLAVGSVIIGYLSDFFAHWLMNNGVGEQLAVAQGLRYSLLSSVVFSLWATVHFFIASRSAAKDIHTTQHAKK